MSAIARTYSKAKKSGGGVVWNGDQVIPVPYTMDGMVVNDSFAFLRIQGNPMVCTGFHAHFQVPSGDREMQMSVVLADANGNEMSQTRLYLNGVVMGGDKKFIPAVNMPSGSLWKLNVDVINGDKNFYPQGLTVTYQLRYSNGPARSNFWTSVEIPAGIGFYNLDGTFVVQ